MNQTSFERLREIAVAFPEVDEKQSHGARCFFILDRIAYLYYHENHRNDGRTSIWVPAGTQIQQQLVSTNREVYFKPTPGKSGQFNTWVGMYLDVPSPDKVQWQDVEELLDMTYREIAPRWLLDDL